MQLNTTSRLLKALADETRMRILHLLAQDELSASDLMEILNMGQSRVSTHLALLKEVGLVTDHRAGRRSLYNLYAGPGTPLWEKIFSENKRAPEFMADLAGLRTLRNKRRENAKVYFDRVAASFGEEELPGRTWEGLARALMMLAPSQRYLDLGIGDGQLTLMLAQAAREVTAVDISPKMLAQLDRRAKDLGLDNITLLEADIEDLPLPDGGMDIAVMSQALHHTHSPARCLAEAHRLLAHGGRLLVIDLLAHSEEWVREKLAHEQLGFTEEQLQQLMEEAGFKNIRVERAARDAKPPHFMTLIAIGTKE
ncbi:MAG: metalloregulator ArsR/SmtB family transcription factor [Planctomycetota bacterium]|nr:metalloregulator ArsR/SmtB family transcription factor [Planctomycetota bacterium]